MVSGVTSSVHPPSAGVQPDPVAERHAPSNAAGDGPGGPPRVPLAFRVGVVGHRSRRLGHADLDELAASIRSILAAVREEVQRVAADHPGLYASREPLLRAVTPLAEGADRIFAEQALQEGFELCCVLPFPRAEFERDFVPPAAQEEDSRARFERLLGRAATAFELDGSREDERRAYGVCGRVVLNQSDLLIAVWDGERLGRPGGTEETLDEAVRLGMPVVWVQPTAPREWKMHGGARPAAVGTAGSGSQDERAANKALRAAVRRTLEVPPTRPRARLHASGVLRGLLERFERLLHGGPAEDRRLQDGPHGHLRRFHGEKQPQATRAVLWSAFRDVVADGTLPELELEVEPFEESVVDEWPRDRSTALARMVDDLRPYYAWPDKLAVLHANRYRSAFLLAFPLAAAAVAMALLPIGAGSESHFFHLSCTVLELLAIVFILVVIYQGHRGRWHERWLDYRLAAELVRHLRAVAPLGGDRPFPSVPAHWGTYGQPAATWMAWYARALERFLGLPPVVVDGKHVEACLGQLHQLVLSQRDYHRGSARRNHRIEERLRCLGLAFLAATLLCCGLHLYFVDAGLLTFLCGFLPALGAALAGIDNQGEFRRIAKRAEAMRRELLVLERRVNRMRALVREQPRRQHSAQAAALAGEVARLLVNEVLDWRVVFLDRPLHPPA